jgi:signal transduction histidine kinase
LALSIGPLPFRQIRVERLIAGGRLALAALSFLAFRLDPFDPAANLANVEAILAGYLGYALVTFGLSWVAGSALVRLRVALQAVDLAVGCLLMWLTGGALSPIFPYLVFSLIAAALRWPWKGTLWTAAAAVAAFLALGLYTAGVAGRPAFELNRFVFRSGYLVLVAALLGYLGAHEHRLRSELAGLAAWPRGVPHQSERHLREVLERAAAILAAPRLLLAWEEPEEPWLQLALWSPQGMEVRREAPGTYEPPTAAPLAGACFLCRDAAAPRPAVLRSTAAELARWHGEPLHPGLRERFAVRSVLALPLAGEGASGWLLALDKPHLSADDLALGEVVARQVQAELDQLYLVQRLQEAAAAEERVRLARDLHDGVIQSLGGAALRLETARRMLADDPVRAGERLVEIQDLLQAEQQDLRSFVRDPGLREAEAQGPGAEVKARLAEVGQRVERYWGLAVQLSAELPAERISPSLAHEVQRIVQEALVNAAKHGHARAAAVSAGLDGEELRVTVADDGHGFPFRGDYDFAALKALKLGPVTLKQRIAAAGGSLHISSSEAGARLDIHLPLR